MVRVLLCSVILLSCCYVAVAAPAARPMRLAEEALARLQAGDAQGAAAATRQALDSAPGDTLLDNLAASILLLTGDAGAAEATWHGVLSEVPGDGLASYGLALVALSKGDLRVASVAAERSPGSRAHWMLVQRYVEYLSGSTGMGVAPLPDALEAGARGIGGMAYARSGDHRRSIAELDAASALLPGDRFAEPPAVLMTFDKRAPVAFGLARLPKGTVLVSRGRTVLKACSGTVSLSAPDAASSGCYVAFRIDGVVASISNTPPYKMAWDTTRVPNGIHQVEAIVSDSQGREIGRAIRQVRTSNAGAPRPTHPDADSADRVLAGLWRVLAPQPSRLALCYQAAAAADALGDRAAADAYLERAAGVAPSYRDIWARLAAHTTGMGAQVVPLWRGSTHHAEVALTFDDGPKPGVTEQLLSIMRAAGVRATFFVIGRHASAYPQLVAQMAQAGMEVEDHTYTHPNLTFLPGPAVELELTRTAAAIQAATGKPARYFRPPGGNLDAQVTQAARRWGLTPCMWTVDGEAMEKSTPERLAQFVVQRASSGAIILLHNGRSTTVEALPAIIQGLRQRGFQFVTVDELAARRGE